MTKSITRARAVAFDRQSGLCFYCKCPMCVGDARAFAEKHGLTIAQARRRACTAEHLRARRDGGTSAQKNIVAACLACNQQRHRRKCPREPEPHRRWVEKRMASGRWHRAWFGGTKVRVDAIDIVAGHVEETRKNRHFPSAAVTEDWSGPVKP
jgi:hypothetical protein